MSVSKINKNKHPVLNFWNILVILLLFFERYFNVSRWQGVVVCVLLNRTENISMNEPNITTLFLISDVSNVD